MVVFAVGDPRGGIHERHGLEVVLELVGPGDHAGVERPSREPLQQGPDLVGAERRHAALARFAFLARQLVHEASLLKWSRRSAAGECASYTTECTWPGVSVQTLTRSSFARALT